MAAATPTQLEQATKPFVATPRSNAALIDAMEDIVFGSVSPHTLCARAAPN